jgi:MYND finger
MREVNFSIPNVNKASVHITTTLYDRRALDCTSTLPLINSLNYLAYLTTSSARIRDILTVDGGVERLVCILKEGRSKDEMHMWKWNLAFQCIVNIGVRGSEAVRTRVVEADMVPVIATILYSYILVIEKEKAQADAEQFKRNAARLATPRSPKLRDSLSESSRTSFFERGNSNLDYRQSRRQAPPPSLDIPQPFSQTLQHLEPSPIETMPAPQAVLSSPPERTTFARQLHHHNRSHDGRGPFQRVNIIQPPATAVPSMDATDGFSIRPVRDVDRLPSMLPPLQTGITSHPDSPTTPLAPLLQRGLLSPAGRRPRRPSIRHQVSTSGEPEDVAMEDAAPLDELSVQEDPAQAGVRNQHLTSVTSPLSLSMPTQTEQQDVEGFSITNQTPVDGSVLNPLLGANNGAIGTSPMQAGPPATVASPAILLNAYPGHFLRNAMSTTAANALMPRDEDVLMSLQLLAYISKYCDLRHYFQATHLVPRLKIDREVEKVYGLTPGCAPLGEPEEDEYEEFLQPDDYNIFPLVEKFTVRHHSKDMQYWACVVMRNLCRKDDQRGGIRQCANYECGKWEEFTRQFAKCRRCRRTKYCSKECQRQSWSMHR